MLKPSQILLTRFLCSKMPRDLSDTEYRMYVFMLVEALTGRLPENSKLWDYGLLGYCSGRRYLCDQLGWCVKKVHDNRRSLMERGWIHMEKLRRDEISHVGHGVSILVLGSINNTGARGASLFSLPLAKVLGESDGQDDIPMGVDALWDSLRRVANAKYEHVKTKPIQDKTTFKKVKLTQPTEAVLRRFAARYQNQYGEPPEWYSLNKYPAEVLAKARNTLSYVKSDLGAALGYIDYLFDNLADYKKRRGLKESDRVDFWAVCTKKEFAIIRNWKDFNIWSGDQKKSIDHSVGNRAAASTPEGFKDTKKFGPSGDFQC